MDRLTKQIYQTIANTINKKQGEFAPLHEPVFFGNEKEYVNQCIDTGWVSTAGSFVNQFEERLAEYCGVDFAVAVANGTSALHLALIIAGVKAGDEVIIPTLSFVATANAVVYAGATPHFADSCSRNYGLAPEKLAFHLEQIAEVREDGTYNKETGHRIAAVVPMHVFGHPVSVSALQDVCLEYSIPLVEDAAEGLGSFYENQHVGNFGPVAALSFNGNKIITAGGGGAILTNDKDLADKARHLSTTAKEVHPWELRHDEVGYNYRMPNLNAALVMAQLENLQDIRDAKRRLAKGYSDAFSEIEQLSFLAEEPSCSSNYWLNAVELEAGREALLVDVLEHTNANGIMTRPIWDLLHSLPMYNDAPRMDTETAESLRKRVICLPSGYKIAKAYIDG